MSGPVVPIDERRTDIMPPADTRALTIWNSAQVSTAGDHQGSAVGEHMTMAKDPVLDHVLRCAEELIDLTRRNRLLYFRHTRTASLEFAQGASTVDAGLDQHDGWRFHLPPVPPDDAVPLYTSPVPAADHLVVSLEPERYKPEIERGLMIMKSQTSGCSRFRG